MLIGGFLFAGVLFGNARLLGYAANAMAFTSGWHYVKQGYGVIAVLSAIRRIYYSEIEKRLLLLNGYVVWIYSWMALNKTLHNEKMYGVTYFTFDMPPMLLTIGAMAAAASRRLRWSSRLRCACSCESRRSHGTASSVTSARSTCGCSRFTTT